MKKITKLVDDEYYLVFTGFDWSASGYDIAKYGQNNKELISQSNFEDLTDVAKSIYELPDE